MRRLLWAEVENSSDYRRNFAVCIKEERDHPARSQRSLKKPASLVWVCISASVTVELSTERYIHVSEQRILPFSLSV